MSTFKFNSRYVLVTYAQCAELDPWRVMERFSSLGAECIIGRELHENGGFHLHVFADFGRKFRSRKTDVLDVDGRHPNIVPSEGTPEKGYDYAIKDGDVVCGGLGRPEPRGVGAGSAVDKWTRITQAEDRDEFWALCHELDPKAAACSFNALSKYADWRFAEKPTEYEHPRGLEFVSGDVDGRDAWLSQSGIGLELPHLSRCMSLVLYGPSRTGKTLWARSLGRHIYCIGLVSGDEQIKAPDVDYAVYDDIRGGMKFFHSFKEWMGAQTYVTVKRLYKEPKLVRWGKPSIWLSNTDPRLDMDPSDASWMEDNAVFIDISEPIFRASTE
ncbi:MAG: replication-associated protein [Genomoviridae sp.]|uniref:replication-associated protein n=1 Tax=Genomoviridae sp. TaxID=2202565 RepID=UPI002481CA50|nr:MAG: replication-associated protein [Genomoviridae sp.]QCW23732.1 MAG: replication-associated protein [Genomoviridae sp.]